MTKTYLHYLEQELRVIEDRIVELSNGLTISLTKEKDEQMLRQLRVYRGQLLGPLAICETLINLIAVPEEEIREPAPAP